MLRLRCSAKPMFSVFKLERPPRLTIDLANSELRGVGSLVDIDSWAVSQVATTQFRTNASTIARVMVNFRRRAHYDVRTEGRDVVIKVVPFKARPKGLKPRGEAELKRAQAAEQQARVAAANALASARDAKAELERLDREAARARREAEHARAQAQTAKLKMAKLSKQARRTKQVEAQLATLAQQARTARREADRARAVAAKAREESARRAEAARRARAAEARSAALAKEASEARAALVLARRSAAEAQRSAQDAHRALARSRVETAAARAEAKKQQSLAKERRMALARALQLVKDREAELRDSRRLSSEHARRVARLQAEVKAAKRASRGAAADSPAARRLGQALAALTQARAEAKDATRRLSRVRVALKEARQQRQQAVASRLVAEKARRAAERARSEALHQRAQERARREAAEKAQRVAAHKALSYKRAAARVSSKEQRLAVVARRVAELELALAQSQRREKAQRARVQLAGQTLEKERARSRGAALEKERLEKALDKAQRAQATLSVRLVAAQKSLTSQQGQLQQANADVARWRQAEARAQERIAAARNARDRREARAAATVINKRLRAARASVREAKLASARVRDAMRRLNHTRAGLAAQARQVGERLRRTQKRLERIDGRLAAATVRLGNARLNLARISAERLQEERARKKALRARRGEESKLAAAKQERRRAEARRRQADAALKQTSRSLARAQAQRRAEEDRLARLVRQQQQAQARLAELRSNGRQKQQQLAGLGQRLQRQRAKLAALKRSWKKPKVSKATAVRNISFADKQRFAEVRIRLEGDVQPRVHRENGQLVLELRNTQLPRLLRRTLDTTAFEGPVKAISSFVTGDSEPRVFVKVDLKGRAKDRLSRVSDGLVWRFDKPARFAAAPRKEKRAVSSDAPRTYSFRSMPVAAAKTKRTRRFSRRRYTGRRIDLDFKDADIHNILRLLSQVGNVNIVTSDDVSGKVTIRMRNVPWDQALDVILRAKGLGQVREGNLVRVAKMADLEKEREAEIARLKQVALLQPLETRLIPLSYAEASKVLPKLQYTLSPRGKLTFDERTNMVIARDIPSNLNLMEKMIRNLDTQTPQVMIEARIIEARTNYVKEIGIQWGGSFMASGANGNSTGLAFPNQLGIGGGATDNNTPTAGILFGQAANPNFAVNLPATTGVNSGGAIGLTLGSISGAFNINLRLSAAETRGDIRIVSAPRITTLDNVEAKIEQGVTIPFSQVSAAGVQTTFKDAKLNLTVKPHVTADGSIVMKVKVERNEPDFTNTGARGQPTILKKQADTEMLVKDGDTAVIGGIYTTRDGRSWQKVPWFADIPVIGWFFKNRRDVSDREEVLVFITPRIINRAQSIGR